MCWGCTCAVIVARFLSSFTSDSHTVVCTLQALLNLLRALSDDNGYVNVKRSNAELVNGLLSMPTYDDLTRAGKK